MYPRIHVIAGLIFSLLIVLFFPQVGLLALVLFFSSFLIDFDHYMYYVFVKKDWNMKNALCWFGEVDKASKKISKKERKKFYSGIYFLHGIEAIILLICLSYFSEIFLFILLGFVFHQLLDLIEIFILNESYDKLLSFFYSLHRAKYKKPYPIQIR
jgi:hypothetical protein